MEQTLQYQTRYVTVTGGEPLAQKRCSNLLTELCNAGYEVSLETSGAIDISKVDARVSRVVDIKTPASGEQDKNLCSNLTCLNKHDQVKFVIADKVDFDWSVTQVRRHAFGFKDSQYNLLRFIVRHPNCS